ncbi:MAG TPA: hypothetical protein VG755_41015, partial [Nannocystaceae bacterium]|nr:hypothetical protein [Nannocystaceae bacterium]
FYLIGLPESMDPTLTGFDLDGNPTFVTDSALYGGGENVGVDCVAKADGSPVIAANLYTSGAPAQLEVHAFDGAEPRWATTLDTEDVHSFVPPVMWLDEDRGVVWVVAAGRADASTTTGFAAALAL